MPDPDLEIRRARSPKKNFSALQASVWSENIVGGEGTSPGSTTVSRAFRSGGLTHAHSSLQIQSPLNNAHVPPPLHIDGEGLKGAALAGQCTKLKFHTIVSYCIETVLHRPLSLVLLCR